MARTITKSEPPAAPKRLTKKMLEQWETLDEERRRLSRESEAVAREQRLVAEQIQLYVEEQTKGKKLRRIDTCGYELAIEQKPKTPAWKTLFRMLAGQEDFDRQVAAAGTRDCLVIRKAA